MKKFTITAFLLILLIQSKSQTLNSNSLPNLAPGITSPISYPNNPIILTPTGCDNPDVRIFPSSNPQSEVHLSVNKQNPQVLLLSANTFPVFNSEQGAYWSTDGGVNWNGSDNLPNGAFGRGDPSTAFDAMGNGYVSTLNAVSLNAPTANGYLIQRTNNNGATWQPQVHGADVNLSDKDMIAADDVPTSPFANNLYCAWSVSPGANGTVQFNRSTNQGTTFSAPITLRSGWGQGTNVQTGPNGEVYVCWADYTDGHIPEKGLGFARSTDGGQNFSTASIVFNYTGIRVADAQGHDAPDPNIGGTRVNSFPSMAVDKSNGPLRGRIYVVYAEKENGNGKAIISLRFSDNTGTSWSNARTISIPNGRQNWFPWVAVDDTNGDIFITYYSLDEASGFNTNTYVASSNDGASSFVNQKVSDVNHVTAPIAEFGGGYEGDYIGITANNGRAVPSWMDNRSGQWQIYVSEFRNLDIVGDNTICSTSTPYSISNLPSGSTVTWSAIPDLVNFSCNPPTCAEPSLTSKGNGQMTLTATITNACGSPTVINKQNITVGATAPTGTYNSPTNSNEIMVPMGHWDLTTFNASCIAFVTNISAPGATNVHWTGPANGVIYWLQSGDNVFCSFTEVGQTIVLTLSVTNSCGTTTTNYRFKCTTTTTCGIQPLRIVIAPNPAKTNMNVSLVQNNTTAAQQSFQKIRIIDKMGSIKQNNQYNAGTKSVSVNISLLTPDVYTIQVFDGNTWYSEKFIKN